MKYPKIAILVILISFILYFAGQYVLPLNITTEHPQERNFEIHSKEPHGEFFVESVCQNISPSAIITETKAAEISAVQIHEFNSLDQNGVDIKYDTVIFGITNKKIIFKRGPLTICSIEEKNCSNHAPDEYIQALIQLKCKKRIYNKEYTKPCPIPECFVNIATNKSKPPTIAVIDVLKSIKNIKHGQIVDVNKTIHNLFTQIKEIGSINQNFIETGSKQKSVEHEVDYGQSEGYIDTNNKSIEMKSRDELEFSDTKTIKNNLPVVKNETNTDEKNNKPKGITRLIIILSISLIIILILALGIVVFKKYSASSIVQEPAN